MVLIALPASAGVDLWTPIGPEGGEVTAVIVEPGTGRVFASTELAGIYRSDDLGATWVRASRGLASLSPLRQRLPNAL
jgi:hypothetical protein